MHLARVLNGSLEETRPAAPDRARLTRGRALSVQLRSHAADLFIATALFVFALAIRRHVLPRDGLLFDDAWVVLGARTSISKLLSVTTLQPGFTALLKPWYHLVSGRTELMAVPVLVGGACSGSVLYLVLRHWSVAKSISLTISAVVAAAPVAIIYSGRVKPYLFEIVIVTLLAAILPTLARRSWTWTAAALWAVGSVLLSTFSAYTVPAVVGAGIVLALHPRNDRLKRLSAVALQLACTAVYVRQVDSSFDAAGTNRGWEQTWNSYVELANPWTMAKEIATHVARLGQVVLGASGVIGFFVIVVAVAGLVWESWRGSRRISARFLLLLPAIAFAGGLTRQIPFGPAAGGDADIYPGTRASLWLLPSLAVGLAFSLDRLLRATRRVSPGAGRCTAIAVVVVGAGVIGVNVRDTPRYPVAGARSAHEFVERQSGPHDVLIVLSNAVWTYAAEPGVAVRIHLDATQLNGFRPGLEADGRVWSNWPAPPWDGTLKQLQARTANTNNVVVIDGYVGVYDWDLPRMESALQQLGFRRSESTRAGTYAITVWKRP